MGSFKFRCIFCRQKMEAQDDWEGLFTECPSCSRQIEIRRDDEFDLKPTMTRLTPEPKKSWVPPPPPKAAFQKPFPPKNPAGTVEIPKTKTSSRIPPPPPRTARTLAQPTTSDTAASADPVAPTADYASSAPSAPKPFPKPFSIDMPKWEVPKKDDTK